VQRMSLHTSMNATLPVSQPGARRSGLGSFRWHGPDRPGPLLRWRFGTRSGKCHRH
jgi:hypothetical protein